MTNFKVLSQAVPQHDYELARQGALSWLGKRYLLAEPLNRRGEYKAPQFAPQNTPAPSLNAASMG